MSAVCFFICKFFLTLHDHFKHSKSLRCFCAKSNVIHKLKMLRLFIQLKSTMIGSYPCAFIICNYLFTLAQRQYIDMTIRLFIIVSLMLAFKGFKNSSNESVIMRRIVNGLFTVCMLFHNDRCQSANLYWGISYKTSCQFNFFYKKIMFSNTHIP